MTAWELINKKELDVPKLWDPFLGKTNVHGIIGPSDTGKSTLLRQLAIAVVRGDETFLGYNLNVEHGRVIYVSLEDDEYDLRDYFKMNLQGSNEEALKSLELIFDKHDAMGQIQESLCRSPADLVIIDPWSALVFGNTNNLVDVRQSTGEFRELARQFTCSFILLHHSVKNAEKQQPDKNKVNGSQAIEASLRTVLELRNDPTDPNIKILSAIKGNHMSKTFKEESIVLKFDEKLLNFEFMATIDRKEINSGSIKGKYDDNKELFLFDCNKYRMAGMSFTAARAKIIAKYPTKKVPSETWFKENLKDDKNDPSVETQ